MAIALFALLAYLLHPACCVFTVLSSLKYPC